MKYLLALCALTTSVCASAMHRPDFGSISICSKLNALPPNARKIEGCKTGSVLTRCVFSLGKEKNSIRYLVENGRLIDKYMTSKAGTAAPFGIAWTDNMARVKAKIGKLTGKPARNIFDEDQYTQSADIPCAGNIYNIRAYFVNQRLQSVSVSSLPAI